MFTNKRAQDGWEKTVAKGAGSWADEWKRQAIAECRKAACLTVALAPAGYWTIAMFDRAGQLTGSAALDSVALTLGCVAGVEFLAHAAHRVLKNGEQRGPAVHVATVAWYEQEVESQSERPS